MGRVSFLLILVLLVQFVLPPTAVASPCEPEIVVTPSEIDFGQVPIGTHSLPRTIRVDNIGDADLNIEHVDLEGRYESEFYISSVNTSSPIIPPGGSAEGTVRFAPVTTGYKTTYLRIWTDDPDDNPVCVYLTGTGVECPPTEPDIDVEPTSINFGTITVGGSSSPETVTVYNIGTADLIVGTITTTDGQFVIISDNVSNQTLVSTTLARLSLVFTPNAAGAQSADLIIPSNDPDEDPFCVSLCGTGTETPQATIHGTVFNDLNGNGTQDTGEVGIPGVTVSLDGTDTTTDSQGQYTFNVDTAGAYTVTETDPVGYFSTTPNSVNVNVVLDNCYQVDFGDMFITNDFAVIYGTVFNDLDGDGIQDTGENGIPGVTVSLDGTDTTTNAFGYYSFTVNTAGDYTVTETDPAGYISTTPNNRDVNVVLGNGYQVDFGDRLITPDSAVIYGTVFNDLDGDGIQDTGEDGIPGVTVSLDGTDTTTNAFGWYSFVVNSAGDYTVTETDPPGYFSTTPNNRDVTVVLGNSYQVDFGDRFITPDSAGIYGTVFEDLDGNGTQDTGEVGIPGVAVSLDGTGTTTNAFGYYSFTVNTAGDYTVTETDPPGYFSTTPNNRDVTVVLSNSYQVDFGDRFITPDSAGIYGTVFNDLDGDGIQDSGEDGIPGVTVSLDGTDTTTNAFGYYSFTVNTAGTYTVTETDPAGYISTTPNSRDVNVVLGNGYQVDFGDMQITPDLATVSGTVFEDINGNGIQDTGEDSIPGVVVSLDGTNTITNIFGLYVFIVSTAGTYTVTETDPPGYISTTPNSVNVNVVLGNSYQVNFGDTFALEADLEISKSDDPDPVAFGANLTYTIVVTNNGLVTATGVSVIDNLPAGTTFLSANPSTGTAVHSSGNVTWDIGEIVAGGSANMTIIVTVPSTSGNITNTAMVTGTYPDPVAGNNIASENTTVVPPDTADLEIIKTDIPDPVTISENFTYILTVYNHGPGDVVSFMVIDDLPDSVLFQSANASTGTAYELSGNVHWEIAYLGSGQSANLTITVTAPSETGIITNYAEILGEYTEAVPGNETVTENTTVALPTDADLEINKIDTPDPVITSGFLFYTIIVTNNGPGNATSVNVTDILPAGTTFLAAVPSTGTVNHVSGNVTWEIGNLDSEASAILIIQVIAPPTPGSITNTAIVSGSQIDPNLSNNTVEVLTTVQEPDITVNPTSVNFGSIPVGVFSTPRTVTVTNVGDANLIIYNISIGNTQFAISSGNISGQILTPGSSANINIIFSPVSAGAKATIMSITSNDPDEPTVNVTLLGNGVDTPPPQPMGSGEPSTESATRYFTVDFLGEITSEVATSDGRPIRRMEAPSPDGMHLLEIEEYTGATDNVGNAVTLIVIREAQAPELPENMVLVGKALKFNPEGTDFDKRIWLTLGYNVNDLPDQVISVVVAYYTPEGGWIYLETETTSVAELGKMTAPLDHFTIFAVLAEVGVTAPPEPTSDKPAPEKPTPTEVPKTQPPPAPARFKESNLSITTSVTKFFKHLSYIVRTGEKAEITAEITNNGEQPGTYFAILTINGERRAMTEVTLEPEETKKVLFLVTDNEPGTYDVVIGELTGSFLSELLINWWLITGTTVALILLGWLIWHIIKRKMQKPI